MGKKYFSLLLFLFLPLLAGADLVITASARPPVLDGRISKGEWNERVKQLFKTIETRKNAPDSPRLYMQYDREYIYIALELKEKAAASPVGNIFSLPRCEIRLGDGKKIKIFAVTLDGKRKYPSGGWSAAGGTNCLEIRIPLDSLSGFRIYRGNIVKHSSAGACALFPILKRDYNAAQFHQNFYLGSEKEIKAALAQKKIREENVQKEVQQLCRQFGNIPRPDILGEKAGKFTVPVRWQPYRYPTGKDFYFMFSPRYFGKDSPFLPGTKNTLPLFRDAVYQVRTWELNRGFRDKKQPVRKLLEDPENRAAGYILKKTDNLIMYCAEGGYYTFEYQLKEKKENREKFIRLYGKRLLGIDVNEAVGPSGGFPMVMKLAGLAPKNKKEAYEALRKISFDPARSYIRDWSVFYPEFTPFRTPIACTLLDHVFLSYGFGMAGQEYGCLTYNMPLGYCVTRGAARQYGKPSRCFMETHDDTLRFPGTEKITRNYTHNDYRNALRPSTRLVKIHEGRNLGQKKVMNANVYGPRYGIPHDDWFRELVYAYMTGINIFYHESGHFFMYARYNHKTIEKEDPLAVNLRESKWYLSDLGERVSDFYEQIVCKEDRGSVYTPVAMMWDLHHGFLKKYHSSPWGMLVDTEGDRMMTAVEHALFPMSDKTLYRAFRTGPYGDIFDVITNDASAETINSYPVLFFCGDVPVDKKLAAKLVAYTAAGGTLIINWKQLEHCISFFPEGFTGVDILPERGKARFSYSTLSRKMLTENRDFYYQRAVLRKGAEAVVFTADKRRDPLVSKNFYGKGKVILTLPDFLKEAHSEKMLSIFHDLMAAVSADTLPLKVRGDVQYQINRNKNGWLVALYNNYGSGLNRSLNDPQRKTDRSYDVRVEIMPKFKYKKVREIFTGSESLSLTVPGGKVRIVEISL